MPNEVRPAIGTIFDTHGGQRQDGLQMHISTLIDLVVDPASRSSAPSSPPPRAHAVASYAGACTKSR